MSEELGNAFESDFDDGAYHVVVKRLAPYKGQLILTDKEGKVLLEKEVALAYDARFGPDVDDLDLWEAMVAEVVGPPRG